MKTAGKKSSSKLTMTLVLLTGMVIGGCATSAAWAERQPAMYAALDHLRAARTALQNGSPDKGGHRVKAIDLTNLAIVQTKKAIAYDNRH